MSDFSTEIGSEEQQVDAQPVADESTTKETKKSKPVAIETLPNGLASMKRGDSATILVEFQEKLVKMGYAINPNGFFDVDTAEAVADVQKKSGIDVTGMIDSAVWAAVLK